MASLPAISAAEWDVMLVLWETAPLMANEVVEKLAAKNRWSPRTVKTLLNRLINKGALRYETKGNRYRYFPAVSRDECVRRESRWFLSRVFGGAIGPMLAHFVSQTPLTKQEIRELRKILQRRERKGQ